MVHIMKENKFTYEKIKDMKHDALKRRVSGKEIKRLDAIKRMVDLRLEQEYKLKTK